MIFFLFWHVFVWIIGFLSGQHSLYNHLPRFGITALLFEVMDKIILCDMFNSWINAVQDDEWLQCGDYKWWTEWI